MIVESAVINDGDDLGFMLPQAVMEISKFDNESNPKRIAESRMKKRMKSKSLTSINNLDDGCLMHILSFLSPIPGKFGFFCSSPIPKLVY